MWSVCAFDPFTPRVNPKSIKLFYVALLKWKLLRAQYFYVVMSIELYKVILTWNSSVWPLKWKLLRSTFIWRSFIDETFFLKFKT